MMNRYSKDSLHQFAQTILKKAGMNEEMTRITASVLVEADLMGHTSHGLNMLTPYLKSIANSDMNLSGSYKVIQEDVATISWDGNFLPGPWLVKNGIAKCIEKLEQSKVTSLSIRNSSHIGCLAVYLEEVTKAGLMIMISCSDPSNKTVAPFGSNEPLYSPNPLAVGIPTDDLPIIFDTSMSSTANGVIAQKLRQGENLPARWLQTDDGKTTDDPKTFFEEPKSTILPLGGQETGYKGFALGILIEALTSGLAGFGRADGANRWGANVFIQIIDPDGFNGRKALIKEMSYFRDVAKKSKPINKEKPVRLPGERAFSLREAYNKNGVVLDELLISDLKKLAEKHQVIFPKPLT